MKSKFKTVRVILYSKKDHVMNTPLHAGSHLLKKSAAAAPFKKSLIFLAVASALCSTAAASPNGWSSVNLKPVYGNDALPSAFDERYTAGQNAKETDGVIGIAAFNHASAVSDFSASLTLNRNNVAASAYTVLLNQSPVTFTGSSTTLRMTTIDGENQSEEDPDHAGSALLMHGDHTDPAGTFNASQTTKAVFAADTTTLESTLKGAKAGSTNTLHLEGNSAIDFTGKTVNITTLTESDAVGQFLHRGATPATGIGIVLEAYTAKNSDKTADTANIHTGRDTTLNISVTGTGTTTPTEDTENFFQEGGAALLAGIYADGGELWAEGDVNIDVNAKAGTAAGMMLYARALDHSTFSELNGKNWEFTNFGNSVSYDHTSTFEKSLTLNVHSDTGRTAGMILAGSCCNLEGINGEWKEEDGYTDTRDPQSTTRVTVNDLTVNVTKGKDNKFASDGVLLVGTRVGGSTELSINGNAVISADNALRSEYWVNDGVVGDGDVKATVEVGDKASLTLNGNVSGYAGDFIQRGGTVKVNTKDKQFFGGAVKVRGGTFTTDARYDSTGFETNAAAAPSLEVFDGAEATVAAMTVGSFDADRTAVKLFGGSLVVNGVLNITEGAKIGANAGRLTVNHGTSVIAGRLKTTAGNSNNVQPHTSGAELYVNGGTLAVTDTADISMNDLWLTNGAKSTVTDKAGFRFSGPVIVQNATLDAPTMNFVSGKNGRLRVMDGGTVNLASLTLTRPAGEWATEADVPASAKLLSGTVNVGSLTINEGAHLGLNTGTFIVTGGDSVALGNINTTHVNAYENGTWTTSEKRPAVSTATFNVKGGSFTLGSSPSAEPWPTFHTGQLNVTDAAVFKNHGDLVVDNTLTLTGSAFHNQGTAHGKTLVLGDGADWYTYEPTKDQKANGVHFAEHFATMIYEEGSRFICEVVETPEYLYIDQGNDIFRGGQIYGMTEDGTAGKAFEHLVVGGVFKGDEADAGLGYPDHPLVAFEAGHYAFTDTVVGIDEKGQSAAGSLALAGSTFTLADSLTVKKAGTVEISGGTVSTGSIVVEGGSFTVTGGKATTGLLSVADGVTATIAGGALTADQLALTGTVSLEKGGALTTGSSQLFTTALNAAGDNADAGSLTANAGKLAFNGGSLFVNDARYNLLYAASAAKALKEKGSAWDKDNRDNSTLWFTGTLTEAAGGTVDAGDIPDNTVHAEVSIDLKKDGNTTTAEIDKSFGGKNLTIGSGISDVNINADKTLTIVGSSDSEGSLIKADKDTKLSINGELALGTAADADKGGKIDIDLNLEKNGSLTIDNGKFSIDKVISAEGNITISNGDVKIGSIEADGGKITVKKSDVTVKEISLGQTKTELDLGKTATKVGQLLIDKTKDAVHKITGALDVGSLVGDGEASATIEVGTDQKNGSLKIDTATNLKGFRFFLDPAWENGSEVTDASSLILNTADLESQVVVGQNSYAVLGTNSAAPFLRLFEDATLTWGENSVTAAAYVAQPITVTNGALIVDGSLTTLAGAGTVTDGAVRFAASSVLVADAADAADGTAMITAKAFNVDAGAKAVLLNVTANGTYKLTDYAEGVTAGADDTTFAAGNILAANGLYALDVDETTGTITARVQDAAQVYGSAMQGTALANAGNAASGAHHDYVNALLSDSTGSVPLTDIAARFDAAMNPAGALTTFTTAYDRASELRQTVREESAKGDGSRLWAHVSGGKTKLKGISTGGTDLSTKTNAYGLTVGGTAQLESVTLGAAFAAGTGDTKNRAVSAKDDFDFYGLSLYGKTSVGAVDLLADASATVLKSNLTVGGTADVDTDVTTSVYSFGVQGQTTVKLAVADVTPFIGANVYHVRGGSYSNGHGAHTASSNATAVEFPVGATVSKAFETASGLAVSPTLTLAVVPTVGNRNIDSKVKFAGAESTYNFTFTDDVKVRSKLGVEAAKGNFRFGVNAGYEWGNEERSSATFEARLNYRF